MRISAAVTGLYWGGVLIGIGAAGECSAREPCAAAAAAASAWMVKLLWMGVRGVEKGERRVGPGEGSWSAGICSGCGMGLLDMGGLVAIAAGEECVRLIATGDSAWACIESCAWACALTLAVLDVLNLTASRGRTCSTHSSHRSEDIFKNSVCTRYVDSVTNKFHPFRKQSNAAKREVQSEVRFSEREGAMRGGMQ